MTITIYQNKSENNKINKDLTEIESISGTVRSDIDLYNPVIQIEKSGTIDGNYCYIDTFDRYYYIVDVNYNYNNIVTLTLSEDVLMSFKDDILNQDCILSRSENLYDLYLQDPERTTQQNTNTYVFEFDKSFDSSTYILVTSGSLQNVSE